MSRYLTTLPRKRQIQNIKNLIEILELNCQLMSAITKRLDILRLILLSLNSKGKLITQYASGLTYRTGQEDSHVRHEGDRAGAPYGVHHVHHHHGHLGGQGLRDDVTTS